MSQFTSQQNTLDQTHGLNPKLIVSVNTSLSDVLQQMSLNRTSCVLVTENHQLVGILTERDIVRAVAENLAIEELEASALMSRQVITLQATHASNLSKVLHCFRRYRIRHLPIVNDTNQVIRIETLESVRRKLQPTDLLRMRRVQEVMETRVICADRSASVAQLAKLMASHSISCVVIVEEGVGSVSPFQFSRPQIPIGIVTERDIVQYRSLNLNLTTLMANEIMSAPLLPIRSCDTLWQANQDMQLHRVRRLVVVGADGELAGIVTQTDILHTLDPLELSETIQTLRQLVDQKEQEIQNEHQQRQQVENALAHLTTYLEQKVLDRTETLEQEKEALIQRNLELERTLNARNDLNQASERFRLRWLNRVTYEVQISLSNINMAMQMIEIMLRQFGVFRREGGSILPYFKVIREECQSGIQLLNELPEPIAVDVEQQGND